MDREEAVRSADRAVVVSCDRPNCVVQKEGSTDLLDARLSDMMIENYIRVVAGDHVGVDFSVEPPQVVYRYRRATTPTEDVGAQ